MDGSINDQQAAEYLAFKFLYRFDPENRTNEDFTQTINVDVLYFNEIRVKENLTVNMMGSADSVNVSCAELDRIVVNNKDNGPLSGDFNFNQHVKIKNLNTSSINDKNPAHILIDGAYQTFPYPLHIGTLVTTSLHTDNLNGMNLSEDVARTDMANNFTAEVDLRSIGVLSNITLTEGRSLGGADLSEMSPTAQQYSGVIRVTGNLTIDQNDVPVGLLNSGSVVDQNITTSFEDKFLYKDRAQTFPSLATVGPETTFYFEELSLRSTMDGLNLKDGVIHTSDGSQTSEVDIFFTGGLTRFYKDVKVYSGSGGDLEPHPHIGSHNISSMDQQTYCGSSDRFSFQGVTFQGTKTFLSQVSANHTELTSYDDVTVEGNLVINGRTLVENGNLQVAKLMSSNDFQKKVSFIHPIDPFIHSSAGPDLVITENLAVNSAIIAEDENSVLLNDLNIGKFDKDIVKKTGTYNISTPVCMGVSIGASNTATITQGGKVDGIDIVSYLEERVLLDEGGVINVDLTATSLHFKKGLTVQPAVGDVSYFAGRDLIDYKASLFTSSDSHLQGSLNLTGPLIINGDFLFTQGVFPFNIDLATLETTGLSKSRNQTVSLEYDIAGDIVEVDRILTNKVAGVELDQICLKDENCTLTCLNIDPCVQFTGKPEASGGTQFSNFKMDEILSALDSNNNSYNLDLLELSGAGLDWTSDSETSVSHLYRKLVVRSDRDWASRESMDSVSQQITGFINIAGQGLCFLYVYISSTVESF